MKETTNYKLKKYEDADYADPSQAMNPNMDAIDAALKALEDEMVDGLSRGEIVRLGNIGTFQVGLRSRGAEKAEEFKAANISKARVNFRPGPVLADAMKTLNFSKVSTRAAQKGDGGGDGDIVDDPTA